MRVSGVSGVSAVGGVVATRKSDVVLRVEAIRRSLKQYGAAIVNPDNKTDAEAIRRLSKVHGEENVKIERSQNAKLTISNFKR